MLMQKVLEQLNVYDGTSAFQRAAALVSTIVLIWLWFDSTNEVSVFIRTKFSSSL